MYKGFFSRATLKPPHGALVSVQYCQGVGRWLLLLTLFALHQQTSQTFRVREGQACVYCNICSTESVVGCYLDHELLFLQPCESRYLLVT